jgi:subtilisin-like proprotein convertase family protein
MVKQSPYFIIAIFCLLTVSLGGQSLWDKTTISEFTDAPTEEKMILPEHYITYKLSYEALKTKLVNAPNEEDKRNGVDGILIDLPMPDGSFETFEVYDSPVFAPKLAAKYPSINSYKGISVDKPGMNVRFDTGPYGLHAAIHYISDVFYIDPYSKNTTTEYLIYDVKDHITQLDIPGPLCGTHDDIKQMIPENSINTRSSGPVSLNVYRFALACTGEWGAIRGTVVEALADMNTGVNRINQIYENELAIRLVLIDENDQLLNFDSQTDPYLQVASGSDMLNANTNIVNLRVGPGSYDIGHVYHTNCDVGGVAALGSMCRASIKAAAVTCHYSNNLNFMAASVTSHEIGHQMTAQHTFNNCNGNEQASNAFEPGSGSTIMSYGGLCGGALNVINNESGNDYYHVASLIQIYNHTRGDGLAGDGCAEQIATSNLEPTASILHESGFSIPENTYFYLEGEGIDDNEEDQLTYTWEQMNRGPSSPLGAPVGDAPHFRSIPPRTSPLRFFPSTDNIFAGNFDRTEVSFKGDRTVDFIFTVRDNNAEAGTAVWEDIQFHVVDTPVKFGITSQSVTETYSVGEEVEVTWNVAGTNLPPVNSERVDILLYKGFHLDFDLKNATVLAKNVFNSGSCKVIMPDELTNQGRIIVKASESIFFSINKTSIRIEADTDPKLLVNVDPLAQIDCLPSNFTYTIESENYLDVEGNITYSVLDGLPEGATVTFDPPVTEIGSPSTMTIEPVNDFTGGNYEIRIGAITESLDTFSRLIYLNLKSGDHSSVNALTPEIDATGIGISPGFSWEASLNADSYMFELATSPSFGSSNIITTSGLTELTYQPVIFLEKNTVYYWRVTASNFCGDDNFAKIFAFNTESLFCAEVAPAENILPINISGSGKPTIQAPIEVLLTGNVSDINVKQFLGEHENNKDMKVSLISPEGKAIVLFSNKCEQQDFNCGFDDASDIDVKCPLNSGKVYNPQESLSTFNSDPLQGTWILQIEDTKSGNGGKLEGLEIEFCSSQVLDNPFIVKNEKIVIPWGSTPTISSDLLEVDDANNSTEELIYTIVELPIKGQLTMNGNSLAIGDQFSQKDIDEDKLVYSALTEDYVTYFSFTVIDGEGGFIGITNFEIEVNELTSIKDDLLNEVIGIYPNPAKDQITIDLTRSSQKYLSFDIMNIQGQKVMQKNLGTNVKVNVDVSLLSSGFYIINLKTENNSIAKKIIIN